MSDWWGSVDAPFWCREGGHQLDPSGFVGTMVRGTETTTRGTYKSIVTAKMMVHHQAVAVVVRPMMFCGSISHGRLMTGRNL